MRVVVLSDIHGNLEALRVAAADARALAPDRFVLLGDLLSYGPAVEGILATCHELAAAVPTDWVLGNHEELYFDLERGDTGYFDRLADWVKASIAHTHADLDVAALAALPLVDRVEHEGVLFAHANPWGDWRYLSAVADQAEAGATLQAQGHAAGVFGHTHRTRLYHHPVGTGGTDEHPVSGQVARDGHEGVLVANAGSVGQPRSRRGGSSLLVVDIDRDTVRMTHRPVVYDVAAHVRQVRALPLPEAALDRLCGYFTAPEGAEGA